MSEVTPPEETPGTPPPIDPAAPANSENNPPAPDPAAVPPAGQPETAGATPPVDPIGEMTEEDKAAQQPSAPKDEAPASVDLTNKPVGTTGQDFQSAMAHLASGSVLSKVQRNGWGSNVLRSMKPGENQKWKPWIQKIDLSGKHEIAEYLASDGDRNAKDWIIVE